MKLRIKGDSLRLRITRPELAALMEGRAIEESTQFGPEPGQRLSYSLRLADSRLDRLRAVYEDGRINVWLPVDRARKWSEPTEVSLSELQATGNGRQLAILVEKDFVCLDVTTEAQDADAFPNPSAMRCG